MSAEEKERREKYKIKRKKWILFQYILLGFFSVFLILSLLLYVYYNNDYFISYNESSSLDYKVYLKENQFYEEEYLPSNQAYISEIIERFEVEFNYEMILNDSKIKFDYTYTTNTFLEILTGNNGSSALLYKYQKEDEIKVQSNSGILQANEKIIFSEKLSIDYNFYNAKAQKYLSTYKPMGATAYLVVNFDINSNIICDEVGSSKTDASLVSLRIPLNLTTVKCEVRGLSSANSINKIYANNIESYKNTFLTLSIIGFSLVLLLLIVLVIFIKMTSNADVNYSNKINKILRNYKTYIQKITNRFDLTEYNILYLESIVELLEIRDTLQIPILMYENDDKTCSQFMIPSDNLIYMFEVKIDDYDILYNNVK